MRTSVSDSQLSFIFITKIRKNADYIEHRLANRNERSIDIL